MDLYLCTCWGFAIVLMITGGNWEAFIAASLVILAIGAHNKAKHSNQEHERECY